MDFNVKMHAKTQINKRHDISSELLPLNVTQTTSCLSRFISKINLLFILNNSHKKNKVIDGCLFNVLWNFHEYAKHNGK